MRDRRRRAINDARNLLEAAHANSILLETARRDLDILDFDAISSEFLAGDLAISLQNIPLSPYILAEVLEDYQQYKLKLRY